MVRDISNIQIALKSVESDLVERTILILIGTFRDNEMSSTIYCQSLESILIGTFEKEVIGNYILT